MADDRMVDETVADVLRRHADTAGDRVAVARVSGSGQADELTYAELHAGARQVAGWLQHDAGLTTGDRVAVLLDNRSVLEFFLTLAACWVGGFVAVPMNARLTGPELHHQLAHSGAVVLVSAAAFAPRLAEAADDALALRRVLSVDEADPPWPWETTPFAQARTSGAECTLPAPTPDTSSDLIYTSGTTGRPKGALFDHRACVAYGRLVSEGLRIRPASRVLLAVPVYTSTGVHTFPLPLFYGGGTLLYEAEFDPAQWTARVNALHPNVYFGVPAMLALILQTADPAALRGVTGIESVMFGGSPMPLSLATTLVETFPGVGLWNLYGLTEAGPGGTALRPEFALEHLSTVGQGMVGMEIRVVDAERVPLPAGAEGEVAVHTPTRMRGYLDDPEATARTIDEDGWLYTGDIGRLDDQGFLTLLDRKNDMIVRGGFNIYPAEVEAALVSHPDVTEAAVAGTPHPVLGEDVTAWVVLADGTSTTVTDLTEYVRGRIADYKVPRRVVLTTELPRNSMGKVLRRDLRNQFRETDSGASTTT